MCGERASEREDRDRETARVRASEQASKRASEGKAREGALATDRERERVLIGGITSAVHTHTQRHTHRHTQT